MKLLGKTKSNISKDENGENVARLEITEVAVVVHYNIVNNNYQQDSIFLYTFVSNKSFGQLLDVSPEAFLFQKGLKKFKFSYIEVWFTEQNSKLLEIK